MSKIHLLSLPKRLQTTIQMLKRSLALTQESCNLAIALCDHTKSAVAHHGAALTTAILPVLAHKHSNVRILALKSLSAAMIVDATGIDDSLAPLTDLTFDKAPAVREGLYKLACEWLTLLMDRYTFGYKILPLLIAGLSEEIPKLVEQTQVHLDQVGALYEVEWESRVKNEMDYSDGMDRVLPSK